MNSSLSTKISTSFPCNLFIVFDYQALKDTADYLHKQSINNIIWKLPYILKWSGGKYKS